MILNFYFHHVRIMGRDGFILENFFLDIESLMIL